MAISIEEMAVVKNIGEQEVLGNLFWTSIGKQLVHVDDLKQNLIQSGLGEEWLPNQIRVVDAFRRATREVQTKKETNQAKVFKNYLVREVYSDTQFIQRNIVVETVDQNDKRLGYKSESGIIKLDKKNRSISFETDDITIRELCLEAEQKFYLYRDHYSSQHMRVMVSKIMSSLAPTPMRPNGVIYFIPSTQTERLMKLVTLVRSLENSEAFQVPVVNTSDNRFMVNKKL